MGANLDDDETLIEHHEWQRDGRHVLTLTHRANQRHNSWKITQIHFYKGGGGFGFNPSFHDEAEARSVMASRLQDEITAHTKWLADRDAGTNTGV